MPHLRPDHHRKALKTVIDETRCGCGFFADGAEPGELCDCGHDYDQHAAGGQSCHAMIVVARPEWILPTEPDPEIHAVRVLKTGQRWNRLSGPEAFAGMWCVDSPTTAAYPQLLTWPQLLAHGEHLVATDPPRPDELGLPAR